MPVRYTFLLILLLSLLAGGIGIRSIFQERELLEQRLQVQKRDMTETVVQDGRQVLHQFIEKVTREMSANKGRGEQKVKEKYPFIYMIYRLDHFRQPVYPPDLAQPLSPLPIRDYKKYGQFVEDMSRADQIHLEKGDLSRAKTLYQMILENYSEPYRANTMNSLAACLVKQKKWDQAVKLYEKLVSQYLAVRHSSGIPVCLYAYFQYVRILLSQKEIDRALELVVEYQSRLWKNPWGLSRYQVVPLARQGEKVLDKICRLRGHSRQELSPKYLAKLQRAQWIQTLRGLIPLPAQSLLAVDQSIVTFPSPTSPYGMILEGRGFFQHHLRPELEKISQRRSTKLIWYGLGATANGAEPEGLNRLRPFSYWKFDVVLEDAVQRRLIFERRAWAVGVVLMVLTVLILVTIGVSFKIWRHRVQILKLKSQFITNVTHELKTPLTSIRMFSDLLRQGEWESPEIEEYSSLIGQEAQRLERMINNVLTWSTLRVGQHQFKLEGHSLKEVFEYVVHSLGEQAASGEITLETKCPDSLWVQCDRDGLIQVLINLLSNGIKYTPPGGVVKISARLSSPPTVGEEGQVEIAVSDSGVGITPEESELIFQKFYRGSTTRHKDGVGLGLMISQRLSRAMGGDLRLGPPALGGTTFVLTLVGNEKNEAENTSG